MLDDNQVKSLVDNLQRIYGFGIAIAFREALRKFCYKESAKGADSGAKDNTEIHWHYWPEAVSFIVTAGVFFHGMNRFFEKVYVVPGLQGVLATTNGQIMLMVDFGVFFLEALIITIAAFRLTDSYYRFYWALFWLYVIDSLWAGGWIAFQKLRVINHDVPVSYTFLTLDIVAVGFYALFLLPGFYLRHPEKNWIRIVLFLITVARTGFDYWLNWKDFYFG